MKKYCERNYTIACADCSLRNYNRDCHNNEIDMGVYSLARHRAQTAERKAAGCKCDQYGNAYIAQRDFDDFMGA